MDSEDPCGKNGMRNLSLFILSYLKVFPMSDFPPLSLSLSLSLYVCVSLFLSHQMNILNSDNLSTKQKHFSKEVKNLKFRFEKGLNNNTVTSSRLDKQLYSWEGALV